MPKKKRETVLCVCAHSDDQVFGPGGTLARYAREGKEVYTVILSYGEMSHPHFKEDVIIKTRVDEALAADKVIGGGGVEFFGLKEGRFKEEAKRRKVRARLVRLFGELRPVKVLTHASDDPHPDHGATCAIVKAAYDKAGLSCPLYTFDVWTLFSRHKRDAPKLVVDVSKTYRTKLRALRKFRSQLGVWGFLINIYYVYAGMLWRNFFSGLKHGCRFAEVFYRLR
ncbi:MAG: PIG-L deacetylase family protein [Candidatus Woesearchaeota archaeon]